MKYLTFCQSVDNYNQDKQRLLNLHTMLDMDLITMELLFVVLMEDQIMKYQSKVIQAL